MHPQPSKVLPNFFTLASLLLICSPCLYCQNDQEYATCVDPFQCGSLKNLRYPFWGGSRPLSCGYPGFQLNCNANVPLLNISSLPYRLLQINFSSYTLKVAREDLLINPCPSLHVRATTFDPKIFHIPPNSRDNNVSLYFNCTNNHQKTVLNQFSCHLNGVATVNVFTIENASFGPGPGITCSNSVSIPVNKTAAVALRSPTASSLNVLREAIAGGFSVQWSAENDKCKGCGRLGRTCVYDRNSRSTFCYRKSQRKTSLLPVNQAATVGALVIRGSIAIILLYAIIKICCYYKEFLSRDGPDIVNYQDKVSNQQVEKFLLQHGYLAPKRYKYSEIMNMTKSFNDKLGQGGYGSVYKGMLPDSTLVAVKVLNETDNDGEEFINEVASISRTSHVNIVSLLGFCYDGKNRALVYEFMPNKSLDKFIVNSGSSGNEGCNCNLDLNTMYNIAVGVAKGLEYLHTGCNTRIVHFDIKPQNILLDEEFCPKISDFGLAKLCKKKQSVLSLLGTRGTIGYIAPEVFSRNYGRVSYKSDIYSYGMMALEMCGACKLVENEVAQTSDDYFPDKIYELVTSDVMTRNSNEFIVEEEQDLARKMLLVGFWCIQTSPTDRPSMSNVAEMLQGSLESIQIPPKPILFSPPLPVPEFTPSSSAYAETESSIEAI